MSKQINNETTGLAHPGGIVVSQELEETGYICYPPQPAWERIKQLTVEAFARGGGDYSAGIPGAIKPRGLDKPRQKLYTLPV